MLKGQPRGAASPISVLGKFNAHLGPTPQVGWLKATVVDSLRRGTPLEEVRGAYEHGLQLRRVTLPNAIEAPSWGELLASSRQVGASRQGVI